MQMYEILSYESNGTSVFLVLIILLVTGMAIIGRL